VAGAWRQVLGADHVGLDDNFFDIGGNSLLLVSVHTRLQERFNRKIPVAELFAYTTVRALSERLGGSVPDSGSWLAAQNQAEKQRAAFARARVARKAVS
jgi:acyl carrier protein